MPDKLRSPTHKARLLHEVERRHMAESTWGERLADRVIAWLATWWFIIVATLIDAAWIGLNQAGRGFDPPPFGTLTLGLSILSIQLTSLVLISQKRSGERDRLTLEHAAHESEEDRKETEALKKEIQELRHLTQDQTRLLQAIVAGRPPKRAF